MEALAQTLQDALGTALAVYLGPEYLDKEPQMPQIIVIPTDEQIMPPTQGGQAVAAETSQMVDIICRAITYTDARDLALLCWTLLVPLRAKTTASIKYGTEVWNNYNVRSATLTVTVTAPVLKASITLARIEEVAAHHRYTIPAPTQEVSDDQTGTEGYRGDFHEHADPKHRF